MCIPGKEKLCCSQGLVASESDLVLLSHICCFEYCISPKMADHTVRDSGTSDESGEEQMDNSISHETVYYRTKIISRKTMDEISTALSKSNLTTDVINTRARNFLAKNTSELEKMCEQLDITKIWKEDSFDFEGFKSILQQYCDNAKEMYNQHEVAVYDQIHLCLKDIYKSTKFEPPVDDIPTESEPDPASEKDSAPASDNVTDSSTTDDIDEYWKEFPGLMVIYIILTVASIMFYDKKSFMEFYEDPMPFLYDLSHNFLNTIGDAYLDYRNFTIPDNDTNS